MENLRYNINKDGLVTAVGHISSYQNEVTDEPFTMEDFYFWKKDMETGEWVYTKVDYKFIIIPCEMLPDLNSMVDFVADVHFEQFDYTVEKQVITTRVGNKVDIPNKVIKFFICKVLQWDEGDKEQVQGIIDTWNANNTYRQITFPCTFENEQELNEFINQ